MPPTFSLIIPSYNEGEDIRLSIESALAQIYPAKEILVIDDSTDNTPEIIKSYSAQGVIYVRGSKKGCCGARNLGLKMAKGDVVILLNADVILPTDFLQRLVKHYEAGADYVLVESEVVNQESLWPRFIEAQHRFEYRHRDDIEWTEGFSCRKQAALVVGGIPGEYQFTFCRDWLLGKKLGEAGFKKVIDRSIVVTHKAPDTFAEYWRVRKARGRFAALGQYYVWGRPLPFLFFKFLLKDIHFLLWFGLLLPLAILQVWLISSWSPKKLKDFFPFFLALLIQELARHLGEWQGFGLALKSKEKVGQRIDWRTSDYS